MPRPMRPRSVIIKGREYRLPIFLPDATRAVVKSVSSRDLTDAGIEGVMVNSYHLMTEPGSLVLREIGGVKRLMNFNGLVASDSGGWQMFSLIHRSGRPGKITDEGVVFSFGGKKRELFSPLKSLEAQFDIGSDIMICLDDFTPPGSGEIKARETVERTIKWARESRREFDRLRAEKNLSEKTRPLLFAVVQGGSDRELRRYCAEELAKIGFDGYGFGGYLVQEGKGLDIEMLSYIESIIPDNAVKFCLGVGSPWDIVQCACPERSRGGWDIFDCTLPTRDARHKRLYVFNKNPNDVNNLLNKETHGYVYIGREEYQGDMKPISRYCDCSTCLSYSRAYLNHLFKIGDSSAWRLATIHNLRTYAILMDGLQKIRNSGRSNKGIVTRF